MNEWEKSAAKDAAPNWNNIYTHCKASDYVVKYEVDNNLWNYYCKKSKWQVFKDKVARVSRILFVNPFVQAKEGIKMLFEKKPRYNAADIEQMKHDLDMAHARIAVLEFANKQLQEHANDAWNTLAAYRKLEEDAIKEQKQKKKAAKKRPSSKKKRKG